MKIKTIKVGYLQANCYILINQKEAIIIDPGDEYEKIKEELEGLTPQAILITHHHLDHIGALKKFKNIKIIDNEKNKEYKIGNFKFQVIETKGHTEDSISFYFKDEKIMFTGDFIFKGTIGRTDLPTGNINEMNKSLNKLKKYPVDTKIYPGHGEKTTLKEEIENNPFL